VGPATIAGFLEPKAALRAMTPDGKMQKPAALMTTRVIMEWIARWLSPWIRLISAIALSPRGVWELNPRIFEIIVADTAPIIFSCSLT
jgi:hypothetical protein